MCLRFQFCTHQRVCILHLLKKVKFVVPLCSAPLGGRGDYLGNMLMHSGSIFEKSPLTCEKSRTYLKLPYIALEIWHNCFGILKGWSADTVDFSYNTVCSTLPPVSTTPAANFPPVSMTPAANFATSFASGSLVLLIHTGYVKVSQVTYDFWKARERVKHFRPEPTAGCASRVHPQNEVLLVALHLHLRFAGHLTTRHLDLSHQQGK